jgi:hypothetical protein
MGARPTETEIQRRIAELLKTSQAGEAVACQLRDQTEDWAQHAAIGNLRAARLSASVAAQAEERIVDLADTGLRFASESVH